MRRASSRINTELMSRFLGVAAVLCAFANTAHARPRLVTHPIPFDPQDRSIKNVVNTHTLFLNRCASGCMISVGTSESATDTSDIPSAPSVLSAFSYGDASWNQVVSCVQATMSRFNITVTDTRPASGH